jgi:hypothetical protein
MLGRFSTAADSPSVNTGQCWCTRLKLRLSSGPSRHEDITLAALLSTCRYDEHVSKSSLSRHTRSAARSMECMNLVYMPLSLHPLHTVTPLFRISAESTAASLMSIPLDQRLAAASDRLPLSPLVFQSPKQALMLTCPTAHAHPHDYISPAQCHRLRCLH